MLFIQFVQYMNNNSRIFTSTSSNCNFVTFFEQLIADNCLVNLLLKFYKKALLAYRLKSFRSFDECFSLITYLTLKFSHCCQPPISYQYFFYFVIIFIYIITAMNHSIITEYQEDNHLFSPSKINFQHALSASRQKPDELYIVKLQARIRQMKNQIRKNKPLIDQLKAQRKFFKKIHEKQKQKIQTTKIEQMKQQYQCEIDLIRQQRHKLQDLISIIHQQSNAKAKDFVQAKQQIKTSYGQLLKAFQQTRKQNMAYEAIISNKSEAIGHKKIQIEQITIQIKNKSSIQAKYREVMKDIEQIE